MLEEESGRRDEAKRRRSESDVEVSAPVPVVEGAPEALSPNTQSGQAVDEERARRDRGRRRLYKMQIRVKMAHISGGHIRPMSGETLSLAARSLCRQPFKLGNTPTGKLGGGAHAGSASASDGGGSLLHTRATWTRQSWLLSCVF